LLIAIATTLFAVSIFFHYIYPGTQVKAAISFTPGNLVVYRVGTGSGALSSNATAVFLDEYTPSGVLVQSIPLPTTVIGSQKRLTASGAATSEGFLTRSTDGQYLVLTGYDANTGTVGVATSNSSTVNRTIARVDSSGNVDTSTALTDAISGGNPRGTASTNGTDLWISGTSSGGGIRYATFGATTSTAINTAGPTNLRTVYISNGQLYISSASGTTRVATVGTGTPTTGGQSITNLPGITSANVTGPYAFFFADLNAGVAGDDTLYIADEGANQIKKFSLVGGTWTANGAVSSTLARGITGTVNGSSVTLYVSSNGTTLSTITDASGYNANITGSLTTIATAPANTAFRGVALAPSFTPPPQPTLSVNNVTKAEGDSGTTIFNFTISLSSPSAVPVTFNVATQDGTAFDGVGEAEADYVANSVIGATITSPNTSYTFSVTVNGDLTSEGNETFFVNVTSITGTTNTTAQGTGTINNDDVTLIPINQIQGSGAASPYVSQTVSTSGIVTARKNNGFFLQTADGADDGNANTSEGIFVFTSGSPSVTVGDLVRVTGTVVEFFNLTEIGGSPTITIHSSGNTLPAPVTLTTTILNPAGTPDQLERFEGMRMHADSLVSVAPTNTFGETFTVLDGVARPFREPGIEISQPVPPDPTSGTPDCCIPRFDENPERIMIDSDGLAGSSVISVTSNVTFSNVTGPLDFTFDDYKILPETAPSTTANMSAVPVPVPAADEFTVAGYNIENFANNATQRQKVSRAIRNVLHYPDVIGHVEILNLAALEALADQVNDDAVAAGDPDPAYEARLIPAPSGGTQHVGFLVKTSRVQINSVTQERATETYTNPNNNQQETLHDRPPLVLRATVDPSGINPRQVIVVVNHLRSFIDIELVAGDGPRVRAKRKAQGESLAGLLQELQTNNPGIAVISVGDYNAYQFNDGYTDPVATIKGTPTADDEMVVDASPDLVSPDFFNLTDELPADQRYSFVFEGTPQALDHVIVNDVAHSYLQRYAVARNNSDFPEGATFAGDASRPERNSDHDMPVAYFRFPPPSADLAITKSASSGTITTGSDVTYTINVTNNGVSPAQSVVVTDNLPSGVTFVSCNSTGGGVCGGSGNNRTVSFSSLASGASATITLVATVNCEVADGTLITNTASVSSNTGDPDTDNNSEDETITASNSAPVISGEAVDKPTLSSPNHKMVDVTVSYNVTDNCGTTTTALSVTSNEPINGTGDGDTAPDWEVVDEHHVRLRAERSGSGNGRIYTITITATDSAGGSSTKQVTVTVPKGNK